MKVAFMIIVCENRISNPRPVAVYECYEEATARAAREWERGVWYAHVEEIPYFSESQIHEA